MDEIQWTETIPTTAGWYWVKWNKGERDEGQIGMWYFDASDYDVHQLITRASLFYGPLTPPREELE